MGGAGASFAPGTAGRVRAPPAAAAAQAVTKDRLSNLGNDSDHQSTSTPTDDRLEPRQSRLVRQSTGSVAEPGLQPSPKLVLRVESSQGRAEAVGLVLGQPDA